MRQDWTDEDWDEFDRQGRAKARAFTQEALSRIDKSTLNMSWPAEKKNHWWEVQVALAKNALRIEELERSNAVGLAKLDQYAAFFRDEGIEFPPAMVEMYARLAEQAARRGDE